jgi:hypothetical protein
VTGGPEKYRQAEKLAKEKKLRIWKNYTPAVSTISEKVIEIYKFSNRLIGLVLVHCELAWNLKITISENGELLYFAMRYFRQAAAASESRTFVTDLLCIHYLVDWEWFRLISYCLYIYSHRYTYTIPIL